MQGTQKKKNSSARKRRQMVDSKGNNHVKYPRWQKKEASENA
jgi:hypothetical protein